MMCKTWIRAGRTVFMTIVILVMNGSAGAQQAISPHEKVSPASSDDSVQTLRAKAQELQTLLLQMREEVDRAQAANLKLSEKLRFMQERLDTIDRGLPKEAQPQSEARPPQALSNEPQITESVEDRMSKMEEDQKLLAAKVDEQYQTKVESASKYRVRLSGMALLNLFGNRGTVDNMDFPVVASPSTSFDSGGSIGATMRQSEIGLEVFGPQVHGARISADVEADFSGEFPDTPNGVNSGIFRLRTAALRLDWSHTSVIAGQDGLFISPLSPTSLASLAVPALSYAGNLWAWTPQLRVEHHLDLSANSGLLFQGGIMDPLDGEAPRDEFARFPQAGERSRQPAYGTRVAWSHRTSGQSITVGLGGYYNRQNWGFGRNVNAWAGMFDAAVPLARWLDLSGEFYRGRGIGGLGAGFGISAIWNGPLSNPGTSVHGLDVIGGWAQLKLKPVARIEFNGALGEDSPQAGEIRNFPGAFAYYDPSLVRNRSWFGNVVYRPRSDLLFSIEYRRLRTFSINGTSEQANQVNLAMGVLF